MEVLRGSKIKCFAILKQDVLVHFQALDIEEGTVFKLEIERLKKQFNKLRCRNEKDFQKIQSKNGSYILNNDSVLMYILLVKTTYPQQSALKVLREIKSGISAGTDSGDL